MFDKLVEIVKIFLEKHFIPTVASIALGLTAMICIPSDFYAIEKIGVDWFRVFLFCLSFLIVEGLNKIYRYILKKGAERKEIIKKQEESELKLKQQKLDRENREKSDLEDLWSIVDDFSAKDKKRIEKFLTTENKPISIPENELYMYGNHKDLVKSRIVNLTKVKDECYPEEAIYNFRLKDNFFLLLKISKEKYGKISHFE